MKRFFVAEIWKEYWFQSILPEHKAFWFYINAHCNTAGVWDVNLPLASFQIGCDLKADDLLNAFGHEIYQINESKWLVTGFLRDQQGSNLIVTQNAHKSAIQCVLNLDLADKYCEPLSITTRDGSGEMVTRTYGHQNGRTLLGATKELTRSLKGAQVKVKAKDKSEAKVKKHPAMTEVVSFCKDHGLTENDGEYIYFNWEENEWKNTKTKKPISNWRLTIKKWKAAGHFPSQKGPSSKQNSRQERISYDEEF